MFKVGDMVKVCSNTSSQLPNPPIGTIGEILSIDFTSSTAIIESRFTRGIYTYRRRFPSIALARLSLASPQQIGNLFYSPPLSISDKAPSFENNCPHCDKYRGLFIHCQKCGNTIRNAI